MATLNDAVDLIRRELRGKSDVDVRGEFNAAFPDAIETFVRLMAPAFLEWDEFDRALTGDKRQSIVSALMFTAISLHTQSMKLLLSGHAVPAGNLSRQVVETIALALLCSNSDHEILDSFDGDCYSTSYAVTDLRKRSDALGVRREGVDALVLAQKFYHKYSHPSKMTLGTVMEFADTGRFFVGGSFDSSKIQVYREEIEGRLSLASQFRNFVLVVRANLSRWR